MGFYDEVLRELAGISMPAKPISLEGSGNRADAAFRWMAIGRASCRERVFITV